jgi:cytochrome c oxidase subunit 2
MSQQGNDTPQADSNQGSVDAGSTKPTIGVDGVWLPRASSTLAQDTDAAWWTVFYISIPFFIVVIAPMSWFAFKYKRKSEDERTSPIDHSFKLELFWTLVPTIILMGLFWVGIRGYANAQVVPNDAYVINATGQMFNWTFTYPDGTVTTELAVPKNKPVKLVLSSKDVIHSFFVPEFRTKQDVVPGLYTTMWFEATQEVETAIQCAEYCGDGHSRMITKVFVYDQANFDQWLLNGGTLVELAPEALGKKKYEALCSSCHSLDGSRIQGPSFKGIFGRSQQLADGSSVTADENYIRKSILEPQSQIVAGYPASMPTFAGVLKDKDIEGIIAFMKTQK